ncbi:hypothetical protein [Andreprevotia chitinilytica]|uniref:hypothetical protein n=1 Tax=Andreprevotia chitinilytica TaxID=396808 RepID=UPI00054F1CBA|nr:hypothetical protein [Andreprevotia chitinilytica]
MRCPKCGQTNDDTALTCAACHAALQAQQPAVAVEATASAVAAGATSQPAAAASAQPAAPDQPRKRKREVRDNSGLIAAIDAAEKALDEAWSKRNVAWPDPRSIMPDFRRTASPAQADSRAKWIATGFALAVLLLLIGYGVLRYQTKAADKLAASAPQAVQLAAAAPSDPPAPAPTVAPTLLPTAAPTANPVPVVASAVPASAAVATPTSPKHKPTPKPRPTAKPVATTPVSAVVAPTTAPVHPAPTQAPAPSFAERYAACGKLEGFFNREGCKTKLCFDHAGQPECQNVAPQQRQR